MSLAMQVGGCALTLLPERAVFLPGCSTLLVADAHFGKAQAFRRLGLPVPGGTTAGNLERLSSLIEGCGAREVVFLGDLLHARQGRAQATLAAVAAWRARHRTVGMRLVRSNHDGRAGDPPADWQVVVVDEPWRLGSLALCHHPAPVADAYVLAGHLHPAVAVGRGIDRLRLPCFHFGPVVGVLPAFGDFTGTHAITRAPGDRVFAIAHDEVRSLAG